MTVWIAWGFVAVTTVVLILVIIFTARERSWQERTFGEGIPEEARGAELLYERNAYYFGTTIGDNWRRRYVLDGMFARGNGELWLTSNGIFFKRMLEREAFRIPLSWVVRVQESRGGHAGKWVFGRKVIKVAWTKKGGTLISGFLVPSSMHSRWLGQMQKAVSRHTSTTSYR